MRADLSTVEMGIRLLIVAFLLLNVGVAVWMRRTIRMMRRATARWLQIAALLIFNVPTISMFILGPHAGAGLSKPILSLLFYPALAWHIANLSLFVVVIVFSLGAGVSRLLGGVRRALTQRSSLVPCETPGTGAAHNALNPDRRRFLHSVSLAVPAFAFGGSLTSIVAAQTDIRINEIDIFRPSWPEALDGLRIAHISDVHTGTFIRLDDLDGIVSQVNALSPDLIVFTGDLCDVEELLVPSATRLGNLSAPLGVYSCLGNHEYFLPIDAVVRELTRNGLNPLVNASVELSSGAQRFSLVGIDYAFSGQVYGLPQSTQADQVAQAFEGITESNLPQIALAHNPEAFDALKAHGVDLVLSGHTHGGQVVWCHDEHGRAVGPVERAFPHFKGLYNEDGTHLYVSSGVGHWMPIRVNCPREIALLTLRRGSLFTAS